MKATSLAKKLFVAAPFSGCFRKMLFNTHIRNGIIQPWQAFLGALLEGRADVKKAGEAESLASLFERHARFSESTAKC